MFGDTDGKRDAMLRFTKPVTGGYYFAPSLDRLERCNLRVDTALFHSGEGR